MKPKSCLTPGDIASTKATIKAHHPVSSSKQKIVEKQEKMFYALDKDVGFQKSIAGMNRVDKVTAIQKKYADNGVKIARKKVNQMIRNGVTVAKSPPVVIPKPPPIVVPTAPKPPIIIPKPPPKIVSIPKEPIPKIAPPKPVPKEFLTEFKPAKTLEEARIEFNKYSLGDMPIYNKHVQGWSEEKKLESMNMINEQTHSMQRWIRTRKIDEIKFLDGDQKYIGAASASFPLRMNRISLNYRNIKIGKASNEKIIGSLRSGRYTVSGDSMEACYRHEWGHALWGDSIAKRELKEFKERYDGLFKYAIEGKVSKYAASSIDEFFAETFAIYSSPQYRAGSLNKVFGGGFEELMEKILVGGT